MPNCLMSEDRESIMMHLQNWRDSNTLECSVEERREAKDALMGEIIRCDIANEVFIIDEVVLTELLHEGEEVTNDQTKEVQG